MTSATYCAIDFGTSNSAVAVPDGAAMRLIELEPGFRTMPTAVFYPGRRRAARRSRRRASSAAPRSPPTSTASTAA
jgi:molecular chaperone DnaK (HSP70)